MTDKTDKKYTKTPVQIEHWEEDEQKRLSSRRASVAFALRTLTESLDDCIFQGWAAWDKLFEKYDLDPNKEYFVLKGQIFERRRPGDSSP